MDDLISRSALLKSVEGRLDAMRKQYGPHDHYTDGFDECVDRIYDAPAVDAVEVKHGRWEKRRFTETLYGYQCSNCRTTWDEGTNFCPYCGADMRERKEE